jgi:transposase
MEKVMLAVGIDISKDDFHACLKEKTEGGTVKIKGTHSFTNDLQGFEKFAAWVLKREKQDTQVSYIMEATGTYYENLAYYLHDNGKRVFVVLPNKIKHFAKSMNIKTKTDKVDSGIIAQVGIERKLAIWKPMSANFKQLRDLSREMLSLKKEKSRAMCQLHAMEYSHQKTPRVLQIKNNLIEFYATSISQIETELAEIINADTELKTRIERIMKVKGLGMNTIVAVLCETNGFELFNNIRQVVSFAGLDVQMNESGAFKGKTRISKKGNARIRQCLFMPALSATVHNDKIKDLYERIIERNPDIKRKGVVAAMRKLLIIIFVLWKNGEEYNPQHVWGINANDIG